MSTYLTNVYRIYSAFRLRLRAQVIISNFKGIRFMISSYPVGGPLLHSRYTVFTIVSHHILLHLGIGSEERSIDQTFALSEGIVARLKDRNIMTLFRTRVEGSLFLFECRGTLLCSASITIFMPFNGIVSALFVQIRISLISTSFL